MLRVRDYIARLQQLDPDLPVVVDEANEVGLCEALAPTLLSQHNAEDHVKFGEVVVIPFGAELEA